jgi:hypothetical protein
VAKLFCLFCCFVFAANVFSSSSYEIPFLDSTAQIDGDISEEVWKESLIKQLKYQTEPGYNVEPSQKTFVYFFHNASSLFIAIKCFDNQIDEVKKEHFRRDAFAAVSEAVVVVFDTFGTGEQGIGLYVTPMDDEGDFTINFSNQNMNSDFDFLFRKKVLLSGDGYSAEIEIPFSSFTYSAPDGNAQWYISIDRYIPRDSQEVVSLMPVDRNSNNPLHGFCKIKMSNIPKQSLKKLTLIPSIYSGYDSNTIESVKETDKHSSFKSKLEITGEYRFAPSTAAKFTINPDFSQVEADYIYQKINNRYPVYFAEKRPFFMDGVGVFAMAHNLLNTRTIVEPTYGLKFTHKNKKWSFFGLTALEEDVPGMRFYNNMESTNNTFWNVARATYATGQSSYVGLCAISRNYSSLYNRVVGIDGMQYYNKFVFSYQLVKTTTKYPDLSSKDGSGVNFNLAYKMNRYIKLYSVYDSISPDFRVDSGFIPRKDYKDYTVGFNYYFQPNKDNFFVKAFFCDIRYFTTYNYKQQIVDQGVNISSFVELPYKLSCNFFYYTDNEDFLNDIYDTDGFGFGISWERFENFNINISFQGGDRISYNYENPRLANFEQYNLGVSSTLLENLTTSVGLIYAVLKDGNEQISKQYSLQTKLMYFVSNHINVRLLYISDIAQWNEYDVKQPSDYFNLLFTYRINAFSKLYFGYTNILENSHNIIWNKQSSDFQWFNKSDNRQIFIKFSYLF